jgi:hypothetical protein
MAYFHQIMTLLEALLGITSGDELQKAGVELGYKDSTEPEYSKVDEIPLTGASIDAVATEMYGRLQSKGVDLPLNLHLAIVQGYHINFGDGTVKDVQTFYSTNLKDLYNKENIPFFTNFGLDTMRSYWSEFSKDGPNKPLSFHLQKETGYFFGHHDV